MTDNTQKVMVGIVVKADGSVPFDEGVNPQVKTHILGFLVEQGHELFIHPTTGLHTIRDWKPGFGVHSHEFTAEQKATKKA